MVNKLQDPYMWHVLRAMTSRKKNKLRVDCSRSLARLRDIFGNTTPKIEYHDLVHETRILLRENSNISNEVKNMILERNIDSFKLYVEAFSKHVQRQFFIPSSATMEDVGHAFFNDLTGNVFAFFFKKNFLKKRKHNLYNDYRGCRIHNHGRIPNNHRAVDHH